MDGRRGRAIKISKNNPPPSPHCSIPVPPQLRYIIFPPGFKYIPPPPPPPPQESISITVPRRPSRQSESITIVPHDRFPGVYVSKHDANYLYTKSLVPAQPPLYHDDIVISVKDNHGSVVEYREWDPYRSKLAAAILSGAQNIWIKPGSRVLVIYSRDDDRFGITISLILLDLKVWFM